MNVLILSAAAKVLLVQAFQAAAHPLGGRVIAADLARDNAALFAADQALMLPRSDDPGFEADTCLRKDIAPGLMVSGRSVLISTATRMHRRRLDAGNQRLGVRSRIAARERVDPGQQPRLHETRWQIDRPGLFFSARRRALAIGRGNRAGGGHRGADRADGLFNRGRRRSRGRRGW